MTDEKFTKQHPDKDSGANLGDPLEDVDLNGVSGLFSYKASQLSAIGAINDAHPDSDGAFINAVNVLRQFEGIETIAAGLHTSLETGIPGTKADLEDRVRIYGDNIFPPPKIKSLWEIIMANFNDPINQILVAACIVSLTIGIAKEGIPSGLIEGTSICIALVIIISVGSTNEYIAAKTLRDLVSKADETTVAVYRGSDEKMQLNGNDLVVGDLVEFKDGQKLPADLLFVSGQDVKCDEVDLTGEPDHFPKEYVTEENLCDGISPMMFAKTTVTSGLGKGLVIAVGTSTASGDAAKKAAAKEDQQTPLQEKLEAITLKIGKMGMAVAVLTALSQVIRILAEMWEWTPGCCSNFFTCQQVKGCGKYDFGDIGNKVYLELLNAIIISITVVVVAIPEGLPLAVTIALSFAGAQMRKLNNWVRQPAAAETMGSATHVCSDKTGTLTKNDMTVMAFMTSENVVSAGALWTEGFVDNCQNHALSINIDGTDQNIWEFLKQAIFWNSSAYVVRKENGSGFKTAGNVTEQGIFKFFMNKLSGDDILNQQAQLQKEELQLIRLPFTSKRKKASIVVRQPHLEGTDREVRVYTNGGPDYLGSRVTRFLNAAGVEEGIDDPCTIPDILAGYQLPEGVEDNTHRAMIEKTVKNFAEQAYRTILVCYRDMSMDQFNEMKESNNNFETDEDRDCLEQDLVGCCIWGLQDPLREGIEESIAQCRTSGIRVIMCTGDNLNTATAISINAKILTTEERDNNPDSCMTGAQFQEAVDGLTQDEAGNDQVSDMGAFRRIIKELRVMGRCSPADKYVLVTGIQATGGVVAVTGDGTNDAPALTKADVGFSMGITGTDAAKSASDIILLDDNFTSIIVALRFGRSVFDNVRKFLQFQLTVNFVAMFIVFFGAVVLKDMPLNAVQMLWVNLIMDTFAALALATEPPDDDVLTRKPIAKSVEIVTPVMWRNVFGHAIYQCIVLIVIIFAAQGDIVQRYDQMCVGTSDKDGSCDSKGYNPFYTQNLYYGMSHGVADWSNPTDLRIQAVKLQDYIDAYPMEDDKLLMWRCNIYKLRDDPTVKLNEDLQCEQTEAFEDKVGQLYPFSDSVIDTDETNPLEGLPTEKALHFTFVFQIFVFMQLFNQINGRKINEGEINVFSGIFKNKMFLVIVVITCLVQVAMVQFGGKVTKTEALSLDQNLLCIAIGSGELIWGVFVKYWPLKWFERFSMSNEPITEAQSAGMMTSTVLRKKNRNKQKTA